MNKSPRQHLSELLYNGRALPLYLFKLSFQHTLFFDDIINSSDELVLAVRDIVYQHHLTSEFYIFSCSNVELYSSVDEGKSWVYGVRKFDDYLKANEDYSGMILLSKNNDWVLYQENPVRMGVFCFNSKITDFTFDDSFFFDGKLINNWLCGKTQRDLDMISAFGRNYLELLLENYVSKVYVPTIR